LKPCCFVVPPRNDGETLQTLKHFEPYKLLKHLKPLKL